jgi:glycosyltransferase involved in cell wall biosynthesis
MVLMKVNFIIEQSFGLKYLGCATVSRQLMNVLTEQGIDVSLNSKKDGFDLVHAHTFGPLAMSQRKKATSIISAHSTPSINAGNIIFGDKKFWNSLYRSIYNKFDYVFAVSQFTVKELEDIGINKPIYVLENGVNTSFFTYDKAKGQKFRKQNGYDTDEYVVLNVAQVTPRKGIYDFFSLAKANPDVQFLWIGGFPYFIGSSDYLKLKNLIKHPPKNLKFTGFVEDIIGAYSGADLLFTPSYRETFGLTIIEADACCLPVLARDLAVFRELFSDHISYGKNVEEFNTVIKKRPKRTPASLSKQYNLATIGKETIKLYENILSLP